MNETPWTSHDPIFAPFWEHALAGELAFPHCGGCTGFHWYPRPHCPHCGNTQLTWRSVVGDGQLYSWTVVHHAFSPEYADAVPYVNALIEFVDAPGARLLTRLVVDDIDELRCGMPVSPMFPSQSDGRPLVLFGPAQAR